MEPEGQEPQDTVSRKAFDELKQAFDAYKAQTEPAVKDAWLRERAYEHFREKGLTDPYGAARVAARDVTLRDVKPDDLSGRLDSWFSEYQSLIPTPPSAPAPSEQSDESEAPTAPPPGAARPAPSPANPGGQVQPEPLSWRDPQVLAARQRGDRTQIQRWLKEGRLVPSPNNPYAGRVAG